MPKKSLQLISLPKSLKNKKKKNIKSSISKNKKKSNSRKKNIGGTKKKTLRKKIGGAKRLRLPDPDEEFGDDFVEREEKHRLTIIKERSEEKNRMDWIQLLKSIIQEITEEQIPFDYIPSTTIEEFFDKYGHKCPLGVNGRNSDNKLFRSKLNWEVSQPLRDGIEKTYAWIQQQAEK